MRKKTVFFVAAGSGGHILPALQLAQQWHHWHPDGRIVFFTGTRELEKKIVKNSTILTRVVHLPLRTFSLRRWWSIPLVMANVLSLFFKSIFYTLWYRPERVISTGGMMAVPFGLAAYVTRKKLDVHELNVLPGKAIKALFPFASTIYCSFAQTRPHCRWGVFDFTHKFQEAEYPLRFTQNDLTHDTAAIMQRMNQALAKRNASHFFNASKMTLFILGGSQGSALLNNLIKNFIEQNPVLAPQLQVIHQTGAFQEQPWETWYASHKIAAFTFSYDERVHDYYALADLIICRAGAGTMFEIAFFQKPCIVIPLNAPTTTHQKYNALAMAERYPALFTVLLQEAIVSNPELFADALKRHGVCEKNNHPEQSVINCIPA